MPLGTSLPARMAQSSGTIYYVDAQSGSNGNDGLSIGQAWATLAYAWSQKGSVAGSIIRLKGTFAEGDVTLTGGGSSGNPITIENVPGEIVTLSAMRLRCGDGAGPNLSYLRIRNRKRDPLCLDGGDFICDSSPTEAGKGVAIYLNGVSNVEVFGPEIKDTLQTGILAGTNSVQSNDIHLYNLWVHDCGSHLGPDDHGIYFEDTDGGIVANCVIHDNWVNGIKSGPDNHDIIFANNTSVGNAQNGTKGSGHIENDATANTGDLIVNSLACYHTNGSGSRFGFRTSFTGTASPENIGSHCNAYGNTTGNYGSGAGFGDGLTWDGSETAVDPLFVNLSTRDLRLQSTSPMIAAADEVYCPSFDFTGRNRSSGDIGAYEYFSPAPSVSITVGSSQRV